MEEETGDVLVLGAGVAGLAAAQALSQAGLRVIVLEARDRIGGRIFTQHVPRHPLPIELGAEFVHGRPPESFALIDQAGLLVYEINGARWIARDHQLALSEPLWEQTDKLFAHMASVGAADSSFQTFLDRFQHDPAWRSATVMAASYVEGFDAADINRMSVQALIREQRAAAAIDGDRAFRITNGYDQLVAALVALGDASRMRVQLNTVVQRVVWQRDHVQIDTIGDGELGKRSFRARQAVVTLPLGVLQAPPDAQGAVAFLPPLATHANAARQLAMGQVIKVIFRFRERFWEHDQLPLATEAMDPHQLSFLQARDAALPTWWTSYPALVPQITGWAGGPPATRLIAQSTQAIIDQSLDALAQVLSVPRGRIEAELVDTFMHNWHADPFARGAYSYIPVHGLDAVLALAAPVENTLFFAGEATNSDGHTGTVHGAIATGRRAARELLQSSLGATNTNI